MDQPLYPPISDPAMTKISVIRGLVVLSAELHILHINKPAADLARRLRRQEGSSTTGGFLPGLWRELAEQVREAMEGEEATRDGRAIHVKRTISDEDRSLVLSGFGLIAGNELDHSRIVLMTEEHCPEYLAPSDLLRHHFLFSHIRTAREKGADDSRDREGRSD